MTTLLEHPRVREAFDAFMSEVRVIPHDGPGCKIGVKAGAESRLVAAILANDWHRARVGALRARIAELTAECERRGDLISDYQIGHYCGDEYKAERTHEALMDYQVEPL